ncbi:hypothetical protein OG589_13585 [Sphaerisporangium sp. NBC_01403]|uniref:hypothetical protein n=1 Tax=Sphaerisporangium sp. NBC_01403 TaxID=2903599 RepID=UPI00324EA76A
MSTTRRAVRPASAATSRSAGPGEPCAGGSNARAERGDKGLRHLGAVVERGQVPAQGR